MVKYVSFLLLALLVLSMGTVANAQTAELGTKSSPAVLPLRHSEPAEAIVADLESFIPEYMHQENIPGLAVALIQDGEVVWTEGFGVANVLTRQPITPETLFEVASNSKVVTAYAALRLVDQGLLSLDEPLNAYLTEPWLPPSEYRDTITLRQVLSHSSGLGHSPISRDYLFAPGRGYSYSATGFGYLQAVIEQITGQSLEEVAQEEVFSPLGMSASSFINRAKFTHRTANGHLPAILPGILFIVLYLVSLVIVMLSGFTLQRIRTGQWRLTGRQVIFILTVAFALSLMPAFILLGMTNLLEFALLITFCGLFLTVAFTLFFLAGRIVIARLTSKRSTPRLILTVVWSMFVFVMLILLMNNLTNLPAPKWTQTEDEAAGSMRATAGDLAKFLIELADPQYLSNEMAEQMQSSQVILARGLSWGLGPGIQHSQQGDALWQWGQHIDFQSIMIIYSEQKFGVVVCTNSDVLNPDVAVEVAHRALGGKVEPIRRAIGLEFNYREGE